MKYAKQKEYYLHGLPEPQRTEIVGEEVNLYETNVQNKVLLNKDGRSFMFLSDEIIKFLNKIKK